MAQKRLEWRSYAFWDEKHKKASGFHALQTWKRNFQYLGHERTESPQRRLS